MDRTKPWRSASVIDRNGMHKEDLHVNAYQAYKDLAARSLEIAHLDSAIDLAYWDQRTHIPAKGHAHRVRHLAALAKMRYRRFADPRIGNLLEIVEDSSLVADPISIEAVNVREWRRIYDRLTRVPEALAVEIVRAAMEGESVWEKTRAKSDWRRFSPYLNRIVELKRSEASAIGFDNEPYDALLEEYEPGETAQNVVRTLEQVNKRLLRLLAKIDSISGRPHLDPRKLCCSVADQESFAKSVALQIGFSPERGRLDTSVHPFSARIGPDDVRITARYDETDFREGFFSVIHEAGHAMYAQGLPLTHWGEPICRTASLGMDECQSLLWENFVARSAGFWRFFFPLARDTFPPLRSVSQEDFLLAVNAVSLGLVRLNADEVTYNLHILVRFDLERALMNGSLQAPDLPDAWREKSLEHLGRLPSDHSEGVMQDVHWASGLIGYFPTYTLGHLYAAQFFAQAEKDLGSLEDQFQHGEFTQLRSWLQHNIHSHGARYRPRDLVQVVTGEPLNPEYLLSYLESKYSLLYQGE